MLGTPVPPQDRPQTRYTMFRAALDISIEARACAVNAGAEDLLALIAKVESRTKLDLRALTNMKGGRLKAHHDEAEEYADSLKTIDDHLLTLGGGYVSVMPHAASTYTAVILDLVQDAVHLHVVSTAPGVPGGGGGGTAATDIAAALAAASEHSRLESTKECTPTYEQERHANMMRIYRLTLEECEHGNRSALYKAHKHMGKDSSHHYPSGDQMPFMKVTNAEGGGDLPPLVGQVGANGSLGVGPGQAAPKHAADAYVQ